MRFSFVIIVLVVFLSSLAVAADKNEATKEQADKVAVPVPKPSPNEVMKQGDFARELVQFFGWAGGLSKEPKDRDYLQVLDGRRTFKFEAEKSYNSITDKVVVRKNELFGAYSGEAWLGGTTSPAKVNIKVFIPLAGDYLVSAMAKGDGQLWKIGDKKYKADSGGALTLTKITNIALKPGELELEITLPPEGGLDYIVFKAPDFTPLEPLDGWRFSEPLNKGTVAYVAASLLGLEEKLPADDKIKPISIIVSEMQGLPTSLTLSDIRYYGKFSAKYWVGAGNMSAELDIPFTLPQSGIYDLKLRCMGKPFTGTIDGNPVKIDATSSLNWAELGLQRLSDGKHNLRVKIPAYGGIDALEIQPKKASPEAFMSLVGITGDPNAAVTYAEMQGFLTQFQKNFTGRK
jgi:hypothetical protein